MSAATDGWAELAREAQGCTRCPELVAERHRVVVGEAPPGARLMLVGEAPGAAEDEVGLPFVGRAGQLLDELLAAAGLTRAEVAVANVIKCRPPRNRPPRPAEVSACRGYLERQLRLVAPRVVVALGRTATSWFLGRSARLTELRGRPHQVDGTAVLPTYHPSAALRFGPAGEPRRLLAADLQLARELADA